MSTSQADIREWLKRAKAKNATHLIVVCDTYDHEDYPIEVMPEQDVKKIYDDHNGKNMQRVMEVYNLSMDLEQQLAKPRVFNF